MEETFHAADHKAWRAWLRRNHATARRVWLISYKTSTGKRGLSYDEAVEEALCFGWIDSLAKSLDAQRSMQLYTPRRPRSAWSGLNKRRVERLIAEGRMTAAGLASIEVAKRNGAWTAGDAAESLIVPPDLRKALTAAKATKNFAAFSPSSRRAILYWIDSAKRPETRAKRIAQTARMAAKKLRAQFDAE